jgi:predicted SAM-dependent methyltransferase
MKLHLGCGTRRLEGFYHIDSRPEVEPDEVADVTNLSNFEDNSSSLIYACHVLEHIRQVDVAAALLEWGRVLKPGGLLRLSVPDFWTIAHLYLNDGVILMRLWGVLYGGQTYEGNTHYACYDHESLALTLASTGFYNIHQWYPMRELPRDYDDFSLAKINGVGVSLNVEALAK